jgi:flagellar motor switch protein FliM
MSQAILSQDELNALMQGLAEDQPAGAAGAAHALGLEATPGAPWPYERANQQRLARQRMPALDAIHERFVRNLRSGVMALTRRQPEVAVGLTKVHSYAALLREIMVPANFNVLSVKPLRGNALAVCDQALVWSVIDAQFGGAGRVNPRALPGSEGREFSATEQRVILRLVHTICEAYNQAWFGVYPLQLAHVKSDTQPQFLNIAAAQDLVVSTSFSIDLGSASGTLHLCLPHATLEPVRDLLTSSQGTGSPNAPDQPWMDLLKHEIQAAEVDLVAELGHAQATVQQLMSFRPGDFVALDLGTVIQAKVDGVPVFDCQYGTSNNRYSIKIDKLVAGGQPTWLGAR